MRTRQRRMRGIDMQRTQSQFRRRQRGNRCERRRQAARIEPRQRRFGLLETTQQYQSPHRNQPRLHGVGAIAVGVQRDRGRRQCTRRTADVAYG